MLPRISSRAGRHKGTAGISRNRGAAIGMRVGKDGQGFAARALHKPLRQGYWEALTQAADNGAGTDLLEAMIRNSCLGLGEQICLLCGKVSASVHAAFCRVYPEEGSLLDVIEWQGKEYPIRKLTLFRGTEQEMETTVSVTALQRKLIGRRSGAPVSKAAERIDEGIYYYCEQEKEFLLPQEGLTAFVEKG